MRLVSMMVTMLAATQLSGCDSSPRGTQPIAAGRSSEDQPINQDLLSPSGDLFPLSTFFGVCARHKSIWGAQLLNGPPGPHNPTGGEVTMEGGIKLKIGVGKFGVLPGTALKDIPADKPPRRIQIGHDRFNSIVLVSDFENAGNNRVSIEYDDKDRDAKAAAVRLANDVVACHLSVQS